MDILSTSVGVLIGLVTTSVFRFAIADFAEPYYANADFATAKNAK